MSNQLAVIAKRSGLAENKTQTLIEQFGDSYRKAIEIAKDAGEIEVTSIEDVVGMKQARTKRLALKEIRVKVENARVRLKEQSVREGKAIDGMANIIKAIIIPAERYLAEQEQFAIRLAEQKRRELALERSEELFKYDVNPNAYSLSDMSDEAYDQLLANSKEVFEARKERERRLEEARIAEEKARLAEEKRIRVENERLKKEAEKQEKLMAAERAKALAREKELENKQRIEQEAREKAEQALRDKKEAELRAKQEADKAIRLEQEKQAEAERQRLLAPSKDKLLAYAEEIKSLVVPKGLSIKAQSIVNETEKQLLVIAQNIRVKAQKL